MKGPNYQQNWLGSVSGLTLKGRLINQCSDKKDLVPFSWKNTAEFKSRVSSGPVFNSFSFLILKMFMASPSPCCQILPKDFSLTATNRPWNTDCCSLNQPRFSQCIKQQDGDGGEICGGGTDLEHNSIGIICNAKDFLAAKQNCSINTDGSPAPKTQLSLEQLSMWACFLVSYSIFQLNSVWGLDGNGVERS